LFTEIVVVKSKVKRISLQRGICSMILFGEEIDEEIVHVLFQNQLWLQQKCLSDLEFQKKYGDFVLNLNKILKSSNFSRGLTEGAIDSLRLKLKEISDSLYPQRNLQQIILKVRESFYTKTYKPSGKETKYLPSKRFIGIGYRDKGAARKPEIDGSPSWQEVSSHFSNIERRIQELTDELENNTRLRFEETRSIGKEIKELSKELKTARAS